MMSAEDLWELFCDTGDVLAYCVYKKLSEEQQKAEKTA